jgi:hypothetical protein
MTPSAYAHCGGADDGGFMRKKTGKDKVRAYPAYVYGVRRLLRFKIGGTAVVTSVLGLAMFATGEPHGVTIGLLSLPMWAFVWLSRGDRAEVYLRVDRDGIELVQRLRERRFNWSEIDDVWMSTFNGHDVFIIRLLHAEPATVMIDDVWDASVETIFENVVRYRKRYGAMRDGSESGRQGL